MTSTRSLTIGWPAALAAALLLAAGGAGAAVWWTRRASYAAPASRAGGGGAGPAADSTAIQPDAGAGDVELTLPPNVVSNARFEFAAVTRRRVAGRIDAPGTVTANEYTQTTVRAITGGRTLRVAANLGDRVAAGDLLAEVYSAELAAAESDYLSMIADFEAVHQELTRTEQLVALGSASQQDLERSRAEHARHALGTSSARARLSLFGLSETAIQRLEKTGAVDATMPVTAPRAGEIVSRSINEGLNVNAGDALFTVADLSTVWVVANVYERDVAAIADGAGAMVTAAAVPGGAWRGRVSYIDPAIAADSRTAKVRVEVANPNRALKIAMFASVSIDKPGGEPALAVPTAAIQQIGERQFVYLPGRLPGDFLEREIRTGAPNDGMAPVLNGLSDGDRVVTTGSFLLRAERERRGLTHAPPISSAVVRRRVAVTATGFEPPRIDVDRGTVVALVFTRTVKETCATSVVVPAQQIRKDLPFNTPVTVTLHAEAAGTIEFACGMNMLKGSVVVR